MCACVWYVNMCACVCVYECLCVHRVAGGSPCLYFCVFVCLWVVCCVCVCACVRVCCVFVFVFVFVWLVVCLCICLCVCRFGLVWIWMDRTSYVLEARIHKFGIVDTMLTEESQTREGVHTIMAPRCLQTWCCKHVHVVLM
jgi:hypothetical protein